MQANSQTNPSAGVDGLPQVDWNAFNPVAMWRDWFVKSEAQFSDVVTRLLKDERAGAPLARQADELRLAHRQFSELAQASLAAANLPSRSDVEALDERLGRVEDGLAQVAAQLSLLREAIVASAPASAAALPAKPSRTRKPAGGAAASRGSSKG